MGCSASVHEWVNNYKFSLYGGLYNQRILGIFLSSFIIIMSVKSFARACCMIFFNSRARRYFKCTFGMTFTNSLQSLLVLCERNKNVS